MALVPAFDLARTQARNAAIEHFREIQTHSLALRVCIGKAPNCPRPKITIEDPNPTLETTHSSTVLADARCLRTHSLFGWDDLDTNPGFANLNSTWLVYNCGDDHKDKT